MLKMDQFLHKLHYTQLVMRKLTSLFLLVFIAFTVNAQNVHYSDMFLQHKKVESGIHKGYDRYDMGEYALYNSVKRYKAYCYIINSETGKKIMTFQDPLESKKLEHHFFKPDTGEGPLVIVTSSTENVSQGVYIFLLEDDKIYKPGFIGYGVDDYNFSSLGFHSLVNSKDGIVEISFSDTEIIDYKTEKVIDGNTIKFLVTKTEITKVGN